MPRPFNTAVMTAEGENLLAKTTAGECRIAFVRMAVGDGSYTEDEKTKDALKERTGLKSERNSYSFSEWTREGDTCVLLKAEIKNYDASSGETLISKGYYINEIGIYAKEQDQEDTDAVLISIAVTAAESGNGDFMPPYDGHSVASIIQRYYVTVSDSAEVTVNTSGASALVEDVIGLYNDMTDADLVDAAFLAVFTHLQDEEVMTAAQIEEALETEWDGSSSEDEDAMDASEVEEALETEWDGSSSEDEDAMTSEEVTEAIT